MVILRGVFGWWVESRSCSCGRGGVVNLSIQFIFLILVKLWGCAFYVKNGESQDVRWRCEWQSTKGGKTTRASGLVTCVRNGGNHQGQTELLCKSHALYTVHPIFSLYCWFTLIPLVAWRIPNFFWNFSFGKEESHEIFVFVSRDASLPIVQSMVISSFFMALGDFGVVLAGLMRIIIH